MSLFTSFFSCFNSTHSSTRISDTSEPNLNSSSMKKKTKTPRAPIPVSYFPINSQMSRL
ncbi:PREDICTED: uncharacterized protein LOC105966295 [Erythranthe guttata]|uniref:uncharacterized protein LOC105966295 n=1 Tax=Erythranthe guttata TaxID=4155 RepID=UPI00064E0066|nr:PREDICTED: uncharacterized protein LOC105966295 [Erythranthe guttata]|eukprot:XP_012846315.1 PREDICTED: uncharacterized protein LOC105966295 [Erythranthe guttata]